MMKASEQTTQQIERFLKKIAQKFPLNEETSLVTDIHVRVSQESGEMVAFDDDDKEITRCVVEQWIENNDEDFYESVHDILTTTFASMSKTLDNLGILKPYSFVLENDEKEGIAELYLADDDTIIIGKDLMEGLDTDLDSFFDSLMKEKQNALQRQKHLVMMPLPLQGIIIILPFAYNFIFFFAPLLSLLRRSRAVTT